MATKTVASDADDSPCDIFTTINGIAPSVFEDDEFEAWLRIFEEPLESDETLQASEVQDSSWNTSVNLLDSHAAERANDWSLVPASPEKTDAAQLEMFDPFIGWNTSVVM